jgi:hypothetical protein
MGKYLELLDRAAAQERRRDKSDKSDKSLPRNERATSFGRLCRFGRSPNPACSTVTWRDAHEERAAIIEYDGGIPRAWAEALSRLHPDRPPPDISLREWRQFCEDAHRFLDHWGRQATALGWRPMDIFGWELSRPFTLSARCIGVAWRLKGGTVSGLTKHAATIVLPSGEQLTFQRQGPLWS